MERIASQLEHMQEALIPLRPAAGGREFGVRAPDVAAFVVALRRVLFPHFRECHVLAACDVQGLLNAAKALARSVGDRDAVWPDGLIEAMPRLAGLLYDDARRALECDPAAKSIDEVIIAYPGFAAVVLHRIAHSLYLQKVALLPRVIGEHAHERTGVDIHPGAEIGERFFVDHGSGAVIGETAIIGSRVTVYQGVTLGALRVRKGDSEIKRHPTIEDDVVLYAHATVLGGRTVVGKGSVIGGNVWITKSVPPGSVVVRTADETRNIESAGGDEYVI